MSGRSFLISHHPRDGSNRFLPSDGSMVVMGMGWGEMDSDRYLSQTLDETARFIEWLDRASIEEPWEVRCGSSQVLSIAWAWRSIGSRSKGPSSEGEGVEGGMGSKVVPIGVVARRRTKHERILSRLRNDRGTCHPHGSCSGRDSSRR